MTDTTWLDTWKEQGDDMPCPQCKANDLETQDGITVCRSCEWQAENPLALPVYPTACPKCGDVGPFWVDVTATVMMTKDGVRDDWPPSPSFQWNEHAYCEYPRCHNCGEVSDFLAEG